MCYGMFESHNGSWKKVKRARGKTSKPVRRFSVTQETIENMFLLEFTNLRRKVAK